MQVRYQAALHPEIAAKLIISSHLGNSFFPHQQNPVIFQKFIADIVNKSVFRTVFINPQVGEIVKVEPFGSEFVSGGFCLSIHIILFSENSVVFAQFVVDVAHQIGGILVVFVVEGVSAAIVTEFLITSADDFVATFQTVAHDVRFFWQMR